MHNFRFHSKMNFPIIIYGRCFNLKNDATWYFPNLQYSDCREIIFQPTAFIIMNHCRSSDGGWWWGGGEVQRHSADDGTPDQPPVQGLHGLQWPRYVFFTEDIERVFLILVIYYQDHKIASTSDMCMCVGVEILWKLWDCRVIYY